MNWLAMARVAKIAAELRIARQKAHDVAGKFVAFEQVEANVKILREHQQLRADSHAALQASVAIERQLLSAWEECDTGLAPPAPASLEGLGLGVGR